MATQSWVWTYFTRDVATGEAKCIVTTDSVPCTKAAKTSEADVPHKSPPYLELEVSNEGRDLLVAYFRNVKESYTPDWPILFPKHHTCFEQHTQIPSPVPTFTFKLSGVFRGSRKTVLFELGSLIRLD